MKTACYVSFTILGLFVVAARANADPATSSNYDPTADPGNPYLQTDPDGIPLSVTQQKTKTITPEQAQAIRKAQAQQALDKNWLLRNYEQQLQARAAKTPGEQSSNLYYQLSSNKELAKLAGLPALDSEDDDASASYRTGATPSSHGAVTLRSDASSPVPSGLSFRPLLTPLNSPSPVAQSFYSPLPISMPSPISSGHPQPSAAPQANATSDSSDLETPGLVSAEKNPLTDASVSSPDLTLDVLPGETIEQAKQHQENNLKLELPLPMDADQLHQQQVAALSVPGTTKTGQATPTPAPVKPASTDNDTEPLPVSKEPIINPVRPALPGPYDILNH